MARRQLTAFLPPPLREEVDAVRRRWDPIMAGNIGPHITVVHDLATGRPSPTDQAAISSLAPGAMVVGRARCWSGPSDGIYLDVTDRTAVLRQVRAILGAEELPGARYRPHVTLTHPRTTPVDRAEEAWSHLAGWRLDAEVPLLRLDVVQQDGPRWTTIDTIELQHE